MVATGAMAAGTAVAGSREGADKKAAAGRREVMAEKKAAMAATAATAATAAHLFRLRIRNTIVQDLLYTGIRICP